VDPDSIEDIMRLLIEYATRKNLSTPTRLRVECADPRDTLDVPFLLASKSGTTRAKAEATRQEGAGDVAQSEVSSAILNVLADACRRHTRQEMAAALRDHFSESAVEKALWQLRKAGALNNRKDGYGGGFGLPEWE
jgi:hypothetical protein